MELITANISLIILTLFVISEGLSLIPSVKANGIFQLVAGFLQNMKDKNPYNSGK